jgi:hypothetical protein
LDVAAGAMSSDTGIEERYEEGFWKKRLAAFSNSQKLISRLINGSNRLISCALGGLLYTQEHSASMLIPSLFDKTMQVEIAAFDCVFATVLPLS